MKFMKFAPLAILVFISQNVVADFTTVARAYEVQLETLRLPESPNGIAFFKACSTCNMQAVNVTAATRYQVGDIFVSLAELRKTALLLTNRADEVVAVIHHLQSDVITLIAI